MYEDSDIARSRAIAHDSYERDVYRAMGGKPAPEAPRRHSDETLIALLNQPVRNPVNKEALDKLIRHYTDATPTEALEQAHRAQQHEAHNAEIDKRKAKKHQIKKLAKDAGISPATLRRMLGRA